LADSAGGDHDHDRDRDSAGRARNARPRDSLGRPLPYGSANVERAPEGIRRTPADSLAEAQRLLDAGLPFHAHEVLEDAWKAADGAERSLWKALAQLAVGLTHAARGNSTGAATLFARGAAALVAYRDAHVASPSAGIADSWPYGIDGSGLISWAKHGGVGVPVLRAES
jgi:hypothetical protein